MFVILKTQAMSVLYCFFCVAHIVAGGPIYYGQFKNIQCCWRHQTVLTLWKVELYQHLELLF